MAMKHASSSRCAVLVAALALAGSAALLAQNRNQTQTPRDSQEHAGEYSQADIDSGSRVYANTCSRCHGVNGDSVLGVDLHSGRFRRASSDDELKGVITNGIPGTSMPPNKLDVAELSGVVAYLRTWRDVNTSRVALGNPTRGRTLFEGKGNCASCHRVGAQGGRLGPDLSDVGATARSAEVLQQHLIDPTSVMKPVNRYVRAVTKDGQVITGRRLNEDSFTVQLIDERENLRSLSKADLKEYTVVKTSPMPSYKDTLTSEEMADLLAYLLSLKG